MEIRLTGIMMPSFEDSGKDSKKSVLQHIEECSQLAPEEEKDKFKWLLMVACLGVPSGPKWPYLSSKVPTKYDFGWSLSWNPADPNGSKSILIEELTKRPVLDTIEDINKALSQIKWKNTD